MRSTVTRSPDFRRSLLVGLLRSGLFLRHRLRAITDLTLSLEQCLRKILVHSGLLYWSFSICLLLGVLAGERGLAWVTGQLAQRRFGTEAGAVDFAILHLMLQ